MSLVRNSLVATAATLALASFASAATIYSENFDADNSANWKFNSSITGDTAANNTGGEANFYYDYSTVGIPSVNGAGGTTRGMKLEVNIAGTAVFSGMSASPIGVTLPAQYTLKAMVWQNTAGPFPAGATGSTQLTNMTVGASGNDASFAGGTLTGVQSSVTGDGGSNPDWRAYTAKYPEGAGSVLSPTAHPGVYAAGDVSQNNTLAYYTTKFPGQAPTAEQAALFANQTGNVQNGAPAFKWREWTMVKSTDAITWSVDGVLIYTLPASLFPTTFGDNVSFGQADINATSATETNRLIFGLVDNIQIVDTVPEPTTLAAVAGLGGLVISRRRRRA